MRLLVCGSRDWCKEPIMRKVIENLAPDVVIEGEARGADKMARRIAEDLGMSVEEGTILPFPADWDRHGNPAGHIRNAQMLKEGKPTLVVAFTEDIQESRGTGDMLTKAEDAGLPYILVEVKE